jgi:hypothetical protein
MVGQSVVYIFGGGEDWLVVVMMAAVVVILCWGWSWWSW